MTNINEKSGVLMSMFFFQPYKMETKVKEEDPLDIQEEYMKNLQFEAVNGFYKLLTATKCPKQGFLSPIDKQEVNHSVKWATNLLNVFWSDPFCDVKIVCKNQETTRCHSSILVMASFWLKTLLSDSTNRTIFLPDFSISVISTFLRRCYGFEDELSQETLSELKDLVSCVGMNCNKIQSDPVTAISVTPTVKIVHHLSCKKCSPRGKDDNSPLLIFCTTCGTSLGWTYASHGKKMKYQCQPCSRSTPQEDPSNSDSMGKNELVLAWCVSCCNKVGLTSRNHQKIKKHFAKSNPGKTLKYQCPPCVSVNSEVVRKSGYSKSGQLFCWSCKDSFESKTELEIHLDVRPCHFCQLCSEGFYTKQDFEDHGPKCETWLSLPKCHLCPEHAANMDVHISNHHGNREGVPFCEYCDYQANTSEQITGHQKRCHSNCLKEQNEKSKDTASKWKTEKHLCSECGKVCIGKTSLTIHMYEHTGLKPYACTFCNENFSNPTELKCHKRRFHHKELNAIDPTLVHCPKCPEMVKNLEQHEKKNHKSEKKYPYPCPFCSYGTSNNQDYTVHLRKYHKDQNLDPYLKIQCDQCPVMVIRKFIERHKRHHHDPKLPLECSYCPYRSAAKEGIRNHEGTYHFERRNGQDRIPCGNNCGKSFTEIPFMRWHMKRFCVKSKVKEAYKKRELDKRSMPEQEKAYKEKIQERKNRRVQKMKQYIDDP